MDFFNEFASKCCVFNLGNIGQTKSMILVHDILVCMLKKFTKMKGM